jgi:integrase
VFSNDPAGRLPWQPNWVTKRFIAYRRRAGVAHFRLHDLRHFMATTMLAAGVAVPVVSERLCHARTSTTVNIYAHAMPGADRDAANLLADILHQQRGLGFTFDAESEDQAASSPTSLEAR